MSSNNVHQQDKRRLEMARPHDSLEKHVSLQREMERANHNPDRVAYISPAFCR